MLQLAGAAWKASAGLAAGIAWDCCIDGASGVFAGSGFLRLLWWRLQLGRFSFAGGVWVMHCLFFCQKNRTVLGYVL